MNALVQNLLIVACFVAVVVVALRVAQSVFGTGSKRAAATEVAAKLVAYPTGSTGVLRRRFVRALVGQHVVMPSGEKLAFSELTVRVAPEDLERLDPDGDVDRLGADAAKLYLAHARREGWSLPADMTVIVDVDHGLRSGWVPPARGTARSAPAVVADDEPAPAEHRVLDWDVVSGTAATQLHAVPTPRVAPPAPTTIGFPPVHHLSEAPPTVDVAPELRLQRGSDVAVVSGGSAVLGRLAESPVRFGESEVSYRHLAVRRQGARWQVKDLGSTNGTTLDGEPVGQDAWTDLRSGAVLALAGVRVVAATDAFGTVQLDSVTTR
ncbi:FhaA domain-containing protein [Solicola sp. PLA-1-18]|uniref:FhaA domain-containing protein n=1 Tax=Solicola sp. PLA-1-18 TaxID=3380532 RepID=UPI003B7A0FD3